jgi:large subunit ribosomal protein L10
MSKLLKSLMQKEFKSGLEGVDGGIFISTQGLNAEKTYSFRSALHGQNLTFKVIRNAFVRKAFVEFGFPAEDMDKVLQGPLGLVYTTEENSATTAAKAIGAWKTAAKNKNVLYKGAFMDGEILNANQAKDLEKAPTKLEARAMLLGIIQAPVTSLLAQIREPHARVVYLLEAYRKKQEDAGAA